ncbi:hypothetical protein [Rhizorhabdus sp.]|uniref:head-tail joining protein n=1 Tax=Rhizorhabdus sp. TaxID=1968843 RepID=UPI0035B01914
MASLSDFDSMLDAETRERLGDPILYTAEGGVPTAMKAFVDFGEGSESYGGSGVQVGQRTAELPISLVPDRPTAACTIRITKRGEDFSPIDVKMDESGNWWVCKLKPRR